MLAERAPGWKSGPEPEPVWEPVQEQEQDSEPDWGLAYRSASVVAARVRGSVGDRDMDTDCPHDSDADAGVVQQ